MAIYFLSFFSQKFADRKRKENKKKNIPQATVVKRARIRTDGDSTSSTYYGVSHKIIGCIVVIIRWVLLLAPTSTPSSKQNRNTRLFDAYVEVLIPLLMIARVWVWRVVLNTTDKWSNAIYEVIDANDFDWTTSKWRNKTHFMYSRISR